MSHDLFIFLFIAMRCRVALLALSVLGPTATHGFSIAATRIPLHSSGQRTPTFCSRIRSPSLQSTATAAASATSAPSASREFGPRRVLGYLWPDKGAGGLLAKLRVVSALALLFAAKLFVVRVPFIFKQCIDSVTVPGSSTLLAPVGWMLVYGLSRAVYTILQELRYLLFTPVGQNALRRFMHDAFEHLQQLDAGWLNSQSTGELSRVFTRGVRGMNALLRLIVFNVVPTTLEALLVIQVCPTHAHRSYCTFLPIPILPPYPALLTVLPTYRD